MPNSEDVPLRYRAPHWPSTRPSGFTLIELAVTVAVIGILATIAMPNMTALINRSRLTSQASEVVSALQLARAEAIRRNARVTVCRSTNGITCDSGTDWAHWIIVGRDNATGADDVIRDSTTNASQQISGPAAGIVFKPSGLIDAQATVTVCMPTTRPADNQRELTVMISGIVSMKNVDGSGVCP